jgi:SAM-dependent methyltransferase
VTRCRSCGSSELESFLHLGEMPLPDGFLRADQLSQPEPRYPSEVAFCRECTLVQLLHEVPPHELFVDNYLYFSSFSDGLLRRSRAHALELVEARGLGETSLVVEVASNDGYLLRNFVERGVPVLGIDPAPQQAEAARAAGVPTVEEFFGLGLAQRLVAEGKRADVLIANNVMAHVPDLNGFVAGIAQLLAPEGVATIENTYVCDLIANCAFDTIYHEHFCYFSSLAVDALMRRHGLTLNAVEHFPDVQGGSLRWHVSHDPEQEASALELLEAERANGVATLAYYEGFAERVESVRERLRALLDGLRDEGASIAAYGAAAKGTVLLNYAGLDSTLLDYVVDRNVHKQGLFMPGVHLPIRAPEALLETRPDYLLLLAWNYKDEVMEQQAAYRELGGRFIVPVPNPEIV